MSKVLVTGGSGFIGTAVVRRLRERGYEVKVLDLSEPKEGVEFVKGDVRDFSIVEEAIEGVEAVVHLAAIVSPVEAMERPLETADVNVRGTANVLEAARRRGARVIYASSVAVYGEPKNLPVGEDHPTIPTNVYGATKLAGEAMVMGYAGNYGMRNVSLRLFNVYGPGMKPGPYAGVIMKFLKWLIMGRPLVIEGDGRQTRDFVYVEDIAEAFCLALESNSSGVFNVGTGREISILELAETLMRLTGRDVGLEFAPPRPGDIRRSVADASRAHDILDWRPKVDLEEGLRRTLEWYMGRGDP